MNFKKTAFIIIVCLSVLLLAISCKKEEDDVNSSEETSFATETVNKLESIGNGYIPNSLSSGSASSSPAFDLKSMQSSKPLYADNGDPCEGTDLYGCQSRLLKLYIWHSKFLFMASALYLKVLALHVGHLPDGSNGTIITNDGVTIKYSKVSNTEFDFLALTSSGAFLDAHIAGGEYTLKLDNNNSPESNGDQSRLEVEASYTNDTTWTVTSTIINDVCDVSDVRAPNRIRVIMSRDSSLYTGKAMLYSPRWAYFNPDPTCSSPIDDDHTMNLYTDFVAESSAAKVNVYMMKRDVSAETFIGEIDTSSDAYSMGNLCNSYYANFNLGFGDAAACDSTFNFSTTYPNPFCTTSPFVPPVWGSDCNGINNTVRDALFGSTADWSAPDMFYTETISLRTEIN